MKKAQVTFYKCSAVCPYCGESITIDPDELIAGGCYCIECNKDCELDLSCVEG